jgi:hypothetical protein
MNRCSVTALFSLALFTLTISAIPQDAGGGQANALNTGERHSMDQLRAIAEAIKKCPPEVYKIPDMPNAMFKVESGPPQNVVWDVTPNPNPIRARFLGYVEYLFPVAEMPILDACNHMKKKKECIEDYYQVTLPDYNRQEAHPFQYRYEFEVTSSGLEFLRGQSKVKQVENEPWAPAEGVDACTRRAISSVLGPDAASHL